MTVHDFHQQLNWSQRASHEAFWIATYRKAFPDMIGQSLSTGNTQAQHLGIDRFIMLCNGQTLRIDEKKRGRDYGDILLEFISNNQANTPGWMEKSLQIDYLAYAFMPSQRVFVLPWLLLRRAWLQFKDHWKATYPIIEAQNQGYKTISVAVPIHRIQAAITNAADIRISVAEIRTVQEEMIAQAMETIARKDELLAFCMDTLGGVIESIDAEPKSAKAA